MFSKKLNKINNTIIGLLIFCLLLILLRVVLTQSIRYSFLLWNLILAVIPYTITELLKKSNFSKSKLSIVLVIWLLFLPNAPYIITDFIHFHNIKSSLLWYDLFIIFCSAFTGLLLGIFSMLNSHNLIAKKWSNKIANYTLTIVCFLSGFGIYLGRFLRFNSWDIITNPIKLIAQGIHCLTKSECWYLIIGFGLFQWLIFINLKMWKNEHTNFK